MQAFQRLNLTPTVAVRSGQWDFLAEMGLAILPEPICQRLDKKSLLWLPLESELKWSLGLIWRERSYLSRSAQAWIALLSRALAGSTAAPVGVKGWHAASTRRRAS